MKQNDNLNKLELVKRFLEQEDKFFLGCIRKNIHDGKQLNSRDGKYTVYFLHAQTIENSQNPSKEESFWIENIMRFSHFYAYAMLFNWSEHWKDDKLLKDRVGNFINCYDKKIEEEIKLFNKEDSKIIPDSILHEMNFYIDSFHWKNKKEVPQFTEEQKQFLLSIPHYYDRYMDLLISDGIDNSTKDIVRHIKFCIEIDNVFDDVKCLTSFIRCLYGKNETVSFDTMLKSISFDSLEAKSLRQFVKSGEIDIPEEVIKLAIYFKDGHSSFENINDVEETREKEISNAFLERSQEGIEILINNLKSVGVVDQLRLSSFIRDNIVNNGVLNKVCNRFTTISDTRKKLLEIIREIQNDILSSIKSTDYSQSTNRDVKDFPLAKQKLIELLRKEINFWFSYKQSNPDEMGLSKGLQSHIKTCEKVISRCENDNYVILLMGEYQTGKTTTLDALCGGKNVGSIGDGTKTSAVPLTISFSAEEKVDIVWKNPDDFNELFSHIKLYIPLFDFNKINDITFRSEVLDSIEMLRQKREFVAPNDWQYLPLWSLVLAFWDTFGDGKYFNNLNNEKPTLDVVSKLTRFPKSFYERWENNGVSHFKRIEAAFMFIKQINCTCSSEALENLKGTVMDCPGLFASAYDTMVTEDAMNIADAILYVLPRERQSGEQVFSSLIEIKKKYPDYHRKLLLSNNLSFNNPNAESIYSANSAMARNMFGNDFKVIPYDALLAYLGYIKESFDSSKLDENSIKSFIDSTRPTMFDVNSFKGFDNFNDAWNERISVYPNGTSMNSSVAINKSGFQELVNSIKIFVEHNKAYSMIFENGIDKVKSELNMEIEDIHVQYIEPYLTNDKELITLWNHRLSVAKTFETKASDQLRNNFFSLGTDNKKTLLNRLSDSVYEKLFVEEIYDKFIDNLCDRFYSGAKEIKDRKDDETALKKYTADIVSNCLTDMIKGRFDYWNNTMKTNQDTSFTTLFIPELAKLEYQLDSIWKELFEADKAFRGSMPNYYQLNRDFSSLEMNGKKQEGNAAVDSDSISTLLTIDNVATGAAITGWAAGYIGGLFVVGGPWGLLLYILIMVASWFGKSLISKWNERRFKKKIAPMLKKQLEENDLKGFIRKLVSSEVSKILESYISNTKLDQNKLERNRDIAISSKKSSSSEDNCFKAIGIIKKIESQIETYNFYISNL